MKRATLKIKGVPTRGESKYNSDEAGLFFGGFEKQQGASMTVGKSGAVWEKRRSERYLVNMRQSL